MATLVNKTVITVIVMTAHTSLSKRLKINNLTNHQTWQILNTISVNTPLQLCHASEKAPNACNFCYRKCPRTCISHSSNAFPNTWRTHKWGRIHVSRQKLEGNKRNVGKSRSR